MRKATKWESRMIDEAKKWASYSKDPSTKVGAVIYNPHRNSIVTTGYNGFPRNVIDDPKLYKNRLYKYPRIVHAEANAIADAAFQGKSTCSMSLASSHPTCSDCAGLIIQAGIKHIIYEDTGDDMKRFHSEIAVEMFQQANIKIEGVYL